MNVGLREYIRTESFTRSQSVVGSEEMRDKTVLGDRDWKVL